MYILFYAITNLLFHHAILQNSLLFYDAVFQHNDSVPVAWTCELRHRIVSNTFWMNLHRLERSCEGGRGEQEDSSEFTMSGWQSQSNNLLSWEQACPVSHFPPRPLWKCQKSGHRQGLTKRWWNRQLLNQPLIKLHRRTWHVKASWSFHHGSASRLGLRLPLE